MGTETDATDLIMRMMWPAGVDAAISSVEEHTTYVENILHLMLDTFNLKVVIDWSPPEVGTLVKIAKEGLEPDPGGEWRVKAVRGSTCMLQKEG